MNVWIYISKCTYHMFKIKSSNTLTFKPIVTHTHKQSQKNQMKEMCINERSREQYQPIYNVKHLLALLLIIFL